MTDTHDGPRDAGRRFSPGALPGMTPGHQLMFFPVAAAVSRAIWALARLGVADRLADGPRDAADLAEAVGADPDALARALRAAAALGVFAQGPDGRFALTPAAELLRSDVPESRRDQVLLYGDPLTWLPYRDILDTLRTGEPAFPKIFGQPYHDHLRADADAAGRVARAVASTHRGNLDYLTSLIDLGPISRVAELRGDGLFLQALLDRHPHCSGTVADDTATVPPDTQALVLKQVLHDLPDADAVRVLRTVREALGQDPERRLFVLERVVGAASPDLAAVVDLDMLLITGGRERTAVEWGELFTAGGFDLLAAPAGSGWTAFECRPVHGPTTALAG
ncbi:O-methyltransferase [Streptomyces sp. KM273126]|uniref:methyltransferase n=1 Tax=Streptomyces sp. KM273126 TaxID=2545247 RepID=UPI0010389547|nr:methyltransferase [Streptomyces sp. KM273126]MBA2811392.1 O-methyltransferase [Streptomyces sp. KM273126]